MKIRIQMKTPDAVDMALADVWQSKPEQDDQEENALDAELVEVEELCKKWFKYGECVTLEIDTVAKTCVVVPI